MMTSISPVGEATRQQRWSVTTAAYLVGSLLGGAATGAVLGLLSIPVRAVVSAPVALAMLAAVAGLGLLADRGVVPLPAWRRQVDERWLGTYRGWVYGLGFGLQLGAGFATIVTASATWVVLVAAGLSGSVATGTAIGATYGLVRALPVLAFARVRTPARLRTAMQRVERWRAPAATLTAATQATLVVVAVALVSTGSTTWP